MSRIGDTPWVCPSCGNFLGGFKKNSKGSEVIERGILRHPKDGFWHERVADVVECHDCGVIFAVDEATVPDD